MMAAEVNCHIIKFALVSLELLVRYVQNALKIILQIQSGNCQYTRELGLWLGLHINCTSIEFLEHFHHCTAHVKQTV